MIFVIASAAAKWGRDSLKLFCVVEEMDVCTKMIHEKLLDFGDEICKFLFEP